MSDSESDKKQWATFGRALKQHRQGVPLTQKQLLDELGQRGIDVTSEATVSKWESGKWRPRAETVEVLEEIFGVNSGDWLRFLRYPVEGTASTPPRAAPEKKRHNNDLLMVLKDWRDRFAVLPPMFVRPRMFSYRHEPLSVFLLDHHYLPLGYGEEMVDAPKNSWDRRTGYWNEELTRGMWKVDCLSLDKLVFIPGWSPRAVIPWIGMEAQDRPPVYPAQDALYGWLREHLSSAAIGHLWDEWDSSAREYVASCFQLSDEIADEARYSFDAILGRIPTDARLRFELCGSGASVYEEITWPDELGVSRATLRYWKPKSSYISPFAHIVVQRGKVPILLVAPEDQEALKESHWQVPKELIESTIRLHRDLVEKYKRSDGLAKVLKLQRELTELQKTLEYEFDLLLTKRVLPGECKAYPDV